MAKLFYTLEEAAEKLGVNEERVKQMASNRQLQPFIDGEKLMFKRDQVDGLAASAGSGAIPLADSGAEAPLTDDAGSADALSGSGMGSSGLLSALGSGLGGGIGSGIGSGGDEDGDGTGLIDLAEAPPAPAGQAASGGSGVSVFDAEEVDHADPAAQTMMTDAVASQGDELALESVGSGSGLLDLTREADDTSLGAELLDEIYPSVDGEVEAEPVAAVEEDTRVETASDASSVFDGSVTLEAKDASGIELPTAAVAEAEPVEGVGMVSMPTYAEGPYDGVGSGMSSGFLLSSTVVLILGLIIAVFAVAGIPSALTTTIAKSQDMFYYCAGGAFAAWLILGLIGTAIGKMGSR